MRNLVAVIIVAFLTAQGAVNAQETIGLKGYDLGTKIEKDVEMITLGGIEGLLSFGKLNDGRVYMIMFTPSKDGSKVDYIYTTDVDRLLKGLEAKFSVKLRKRAKSEYSDDFSATGETNNCTVWLSTESNKYRDGGTEKMTLAIWDNTLREISQAEEQAAASSDF
jgi:hypothetical protein